MSKIDDLQRERSARLTADRTEIKFVMPAHQVAGFAQSMAPLLQPHLYYEAGVEPSQRAGHHAEHYATTVYFDTVDKDLYRAAVCEPVHVKVRAREYYEVASGQSDLTADPQHIVQPRPVTWLELKSRDGHRSRKRRACIAKSDVQRLLDELDLNADGSGAFQPANGGDLAEIIAELHAVRRLLRGPLRASCIVNYRRLSWQDERDALRITLDRDVCAFAPPAELWTHGQALSRRVLGRPEREEPRSVLEVKSRGQLPAWLGQVLAKHEAIEVEYSKFVMASRAVHGSI